MKATLWGPDAPIINRYQEALETNGWRVTRVGKLPNDFCWVALQLLRGQDAYTYLMERGFSVFDFKVKHNDEVGAFIRELKGLGRGWDDDPLDMGRVRA